MGSGSSIGLVALTGVAAVATGAIWLDERLFALAVAAMPALGLLLALGRGRLAGRGGPVASPALVWSFVLAFLLVVGGFALLLAPRGQGWAERSLGGLPYVLGVEVWILAAVPLVLLGWLFGRGFDSWAPTGSEVDSVRRIAREEAETD